MMMLCRILVLYIVGRTLQEGSGLPLSENPVQASHLSHIRTKRCSCSSWEDKECIYFCHLDIIWVNTPSKLLPYGLGSPLPRRRRSAGRCECFNPADRSCRRFCHGSSQDARGETLEPGVKALNQLLASFRLAVKSNMATTRSLRSERDSTNRTRR